MQFFIQDRITPTGVYLLNMACDIYIAQFLEGIKLLGNNYPSPKQYVQRNFEDETEIFDCLLEQHYESKVQLLGTASRKSKDMVGLENLRIYKKGEEILK